MQVGLLDGPLVQAGLLEEPCADCFVGRTPYAGDPVKVGLFKGPCAGWFVNSILLHIAISEKNVLQDSL